jgi:predicted Fe-S protein YdhL (DUF1289 family)
MKELLVALSIATFAFASASALVQGGPDNDTPPLTAAETAQAKAERAAAQAKWAKLTPEERAAVKRNAQQKRLMDLSPLELVSDNDTSELTPEQTAKLKAEREAARAKWATLSPDEKAAMRKTARQKKLSEDLNTLEKFAGAGS